MFEMFKKAKNFTMKEILNGIQNAVSMADDSLKKHNLKIFHQLFTVDINDENPIYTPKKISINTGDKITDFPLFALVNHNRIAIDNITIEFDASIIEGSDIEEHCGILGDEHFDQRMADIVMSLGKSYDGKAKITIVFKCIDPPEGVSRIIDSLGNNMNY